MKRNFCWLLFSCSEKSPKSLITFAVISHAPLHSGSSQAASRPVPLEHLSQSSPSEMGLLWCLLLCMPVGEPSELVRRGESERKRESVEKHAWEGSPIALMYRCECLHVRICTHMHTCSVCTHMCFSACTCEYEHTRARVRCHVDECTCMCTHVV